MKKHTVYQCEICEDESRDEKAILACEAKGRPTPFPKGLIIAHHDNKKDGDYKLTFAVARYTDYGHWFDYSGWAMRDNGAGDSVGKELCGPLNAYGNPDPNAPTFKRMVAYLKKEGIPITVFYKKEVVSLDTFLARAKRDGILKRMEVEA